MWQIIGVIAIWLLSFVAGFIAGMAAVVWSQND